MKIKKISFIAIVCSVFSFYLFAMETAKVCYKNPYQKVGVLAYTQDGKVLLGIDARGGWSVFAGKNFIPQDPVFSAMYTFFDKTRGIYSTDLTENDFRHFVTFKSWHDSDESDMILFFVQVPYVEPKKFLEQQPLTRTSALMQDYAWVNVSELQKAKEIIVTDDGRPLDLFSAFRFALRNPLVQKKLCDLNLFGSIVGCGVEPPSKDLVLRKDYDSYDGQPFIQNSAVIINPLVDYNGEVNFALIFYTNDGRVLLTKDKRSGWSVLAGKLRSGQNFWPELGSKVARRTKGFINLYDWCLRKVVVLKNLDKPLFVIFLKQAKEKELVTLNPCMAHDLCYEWAWAKDLKNAKYSVKGNYGELGLFIIFLHTLSMSPIKEEFGLLEPGRAKGLC